MITPFTAPNPKPSTRSNGPSIDERDAFALAREREQQLQQADEDVVDVEEQVERRGDVVGLQAVAHALLDMGRPGGMLDARDELSAGPAALISIGTTARL